ncbi:CobW family GTP-binding protein [Tomitella biformata]|uniref:CobW family GTP-binding protein n=1 Tax=Tomitella biformata TaxID=630403 RepID=UPI0004638735|nr:GTP-binding protein [Tomitella biformata]
MTSADPRIPTLVLAGFLGSGKTTMLNHLLRNQIGVRIGVIVNDFGAVNIDALLVAGQVDSAISIGNGCVCCVSDVAELDAMLDRLSQRGAGIDAIIIEASGLAEPRELIRMIAGSTVDRIRYGGLIEVVDAAEYPANRIAHPELDQHVRLADLVVLNKADRLTPDALAELRAELEPLCGPVPIVTTAHGRLDPTLLFDERELTLPDGPRQMTIDEILAEIEAESTSADIHSHLHTDFDSISFESPQPLHPRRLMDLLQNSPAGLYRVKGLVSLGDAAAAEAFEVQTVGRHITVRRSPRPRDPMTRLVAIGAGIDASALTDGLARCVSGPDEKMDENAMFSVLRFLG